MIDQNKVYSLKHCNEKTIKEFIELIKKDGCTLGCEDVFNIKTNYIEFNDTYYRYQWSLTSTKPYNKELVIYEKINKNKID